MMMLVAFVFIIPVVLGLLMAAGIYKYGSTAAYDANMKPLIANDMHWVYLAVVVLGRCVSFVNMFPMGYKSKVCASQIFASIAPAPARAYVFSGFVNQTTRFLLIWAPSFLRCLPCPVAPRPLTFTCMWGGGDGC